MTTLTSSRAAATSLPASQERYGVAKDEAERQLAEWERKASDSWFTEDKNRT
jgi:hypothetical protein